MFSDQVAQYKFGTSWSGSENTHLRGFETTVSDLNYAATGAYQAANSQERIDIKLVKNSSGGTLADKKVVKWKATAIGTEVDSLCGDEEKGAGIVAAFGRSTGTIPDGEHFWLVTRGRRTVVSDGSAITNLSALTTAANGKVKLQDAAVGDIAAHCGIANANPADVDGTEFEAFVSFDY